MATVRERRIVTGIAEAPRKTPLAIEAPKPPARTRSPREYPVGVEHSPRNPDAITSVTVIVTYADKPTTSETWTANELSRYTDERHVLHSKIDKRTITIEATEWYK